MTKQELFSLKEPHDRIVDAGRELNRMMAAAQSYRGNRKDPHRAENLWLDIAEQRDEVKLIAEEYIRVRAGLIPKINAIKDEALRGVVWLRCIEWLQWPEIEPCYQTKDEFYMMRQRFYSFVKSLEDSRE